MNDVYELANSLIALFLLVFIPHVVRCMLFYRQAAFGDFVVKEIEIAKEKAKRKAHEFAVVDKKEGSFRHKDFAQNADVDNFGELWGIHQFSESDFRIR